jgi:hypothetical protein
MDEHARPEAGQHFKKQIVDVAANLGDMGGIDKQNVILA